MIINDKKDRKIKAAGKVKEVGKPEEVFAVFGHPMYEQSGFWMDWLIKPRYSSDKTADSGLTPSQAAGRSGQLREKIAEKVFEDTQQGKIGS